MLTRSNVKLRLGLRVLFWTALAAALVRAIWPDPFTEPYVGDWDKATHGVGAFFLVMLGAVAYARTPLPFIGLGVLAFGGLIEGLQAIPALDRDASFADLVADAIGIGVALIPTMLPGLRETLRRR